MNNKGQTVLSEHVMVFFIIVAALVAITTYAQRGIQARIHDARNYMFNEVQNTIVCDANCLAAAGGNIYAEYEPYYEEMVSEAVSKDGQMKGETPGSALATGEKYINSINSETQAISTGGQLPPECAGPHPPPYLNCPN